MIRSTARRTNKQFTMFKSQINFVTYLIYRLYKKVTFPKKLDGICHGTICPMGLSFSQVGVLMSTPKF